MLSLTRSQPLRLNSTIWEKTPARLRIFTSVKHKSANRCRDYSKLSPLETAEQPPKIVNHTDLSFMRLNLLFFLVFVSYSYGQPPQISGLQRHTKADPAFAGEVLVSELSCTACHTRSENVAPKKGPRLKQVGQRVHPEYLEKFIAAPHPVSYTHLTLPTTPYV